MVGERATEGDAETSWEDGRGAERTAALELVAREKTSSVCFIWPRAN